jgi:hypothetical protein
MTRERRREQVNLITPRPLSATVLFREKQAHRSVRFCSASSGLTPELTGREEPLTKPSLADEGNAIRAPFE